MAHIVNTTNCVGQRAAETASQWSAFRKSGIEIFDSSLALSGTCPVEADRSQEVPPKKNTENLDMKQIDTSMIIHKNTPIHNFNFQRNWKKTGSPPATVAPKPTWGSFDLKTLGGHNKTKALSWH